ncbi:MAG: rhomboid family intramembrane serine protease [Microbacteriaceae bacterium]|nr:rhomboid family intramembrane serine protease [Microbacteriaceae bacterium]MCL2794717.1 rhomboid family intramembrane serine protease [Microbacteriaceae bacterium]
MTDHNTDPSTCYRHPDRQSFVLCQRCGRTICGECQTPAPVGVICPECMREARASAPRTRPEAVRRIGYLSRSGQPVMTYALMALCVFVFILQSLPGLGSHITSALLYASPYSYATGSATAQAYGVSFEPWRLLTSVFAHASILHIGLNMYTLWIFGQILEPMIGKWRYLTLFLISGVAGSVGMLVLAPGHAAIGASGAIFGMFGCLLILQRKLGGPIRQLVVLIVINLVLGFIPLFGATIAWQAHVGGLAGGLLVGLVLAETRRISQRPLQAVLLGVVGLAAVLAGVAPALF